MNSSMPYHMIHCLRSLYHSIRYSVTSLCDTCSALENGMGKSGYVPSSPALSSLFPTPVFIVQIHDERRFPSESPINASNSPQTSSALRMGRVLFQSGSTSGSDSASIALWDAQYFSAALLTFIWDLLIAKLVQVLCRTPRTYLFFCW